VGGLYLIGLFLISLFVLFIRSIIKDYLGGLHIDLVVCGRGGYALIDNLFFDLWMLLCIFFGPTCHASNIPLFVFYILH